MDLDVFTFLLDAAFHVVSAVASALEFVLYFNKGLSPGNVFSLLLCASLFVFHALEIRYYQRRITVRRVD